jgi:hypothetical protein
MTINTAEWAIDVTTSLFPKPATKPEPGVQAPETEEVR